MLHAATDLPLSFFHDITRYSKREHLNQRENRLTEITRFTLERVEGLALHFVKALGLELPEWVTADGQPGPPLVETQTAITVGDRRGYVDLLLTFSGQNNGIRNEKLVLIVEVKHGAPIDPTQIATYQEYLRERRKAEDAETRLVILAPSRLLRLNNWFSEHGGEPVPVRRWEAVGRSMKNYLEQNGGRLSELENGWLLEGFLEYLMGEGLMNADPIDPGQMAALARTTADLGRLEERIRELLNSSWGDEQAFGRAGRVSAYHVFGTRDGGGGWLEFSFFTARDMGHAEDDPDDLILAAGRSWESDASIPEAWENENDGFRRFEHHSHHRRIRVFRFTDLDAADSLENQAFQLAEWVYETFQRSSENVQTPFGQALRDSGQS